jgi:hypothetical protein
VYTSAHKTEKSSAHREKPLRALDSISYKKRLQTQVLSVWLRRQDLNLRLLGYEPNELPAAPPQYFKTTASKPSNNCLTPLLFSNFSHHASRLLIALYGKNHGSTLHGIE